MADSGADVQRRRGEVQSAPECTKGHVALRVFRGAVGCKVHRGVKDRGVMWSGGHREVRAEGIVGCRVHLSVPNQG